MPNPQLLRTTQCEILLKEFDNGDLSLEHSKIPHGSQIALATLLLKEANSYIATDDLLDEMNNIKYEKSSIRKI